jgi:hypothetical protein
MPPRGAHRPKTQRDRQKRLGAADALVEAIRRRGSNPRNLRDAAHEACHALEVGLRQPWQRERIHSALCEKVTGPGGHLDNASFVAAELRARAVETLVCQAFEVDYDIEGWAAISYVEALLAYGVRLPSVEWVCSGIEQHMDNRETVRIAARIRQLR